MTQSWHSTFKKVTEVFVLKLLNFAEFLEENCFKLQLFEFKMDLMMLYHIVLVSSFQQNVQNLKSIHFCRN